MALIEQEYLIWFVLTPHIKKALMPHNLNSHGCTHHVLITEGNGMYKVGVATNGIIFTPKRNENWATGSNTELVKHTHART
jgi:hypothetical protein